MRRYWHVAGGLAAVVATSVAAIQLPPSEPPAAVQSLLSCRAIGDSAQRLACYDKAAQGFATAVEKKEVVMIDKARANEARRSLFGFSVPNFGALFGGGGDEISQVEGVVQEVTENGDGSLVLRLADGSTWNQVDDTPVALPPRRGDKVLIRRGALGAYFIKFGSQPGFKARRIG
jgi:hypothetical protein